jgi:hypothetical protein
MATATARRTPTPVAAATAAAVARKLSPGIAIGPTIDKMKDLQNAKAELNAQIKKLDVEYDELELQLFEKLDREGTTKGAGKHASASITSSVVGNVTNWDLVFPYIKKTGYFHLFIKQLNAAALRELFDKGVKVPGVEPFTKRRLSIKAI